MAKVRYSDYNVRLCLDFKHFKASEFCCGCGCGYPARIDAKLLYRLELLRKYFGKPVVITSGLRCKKYNASLKGSSKRSAHLTGDAADVYIKGIDPRDIVNFWLKRDFGYSYCGTPNMGNCAHVQVK